MASFSNIAHGDWNTDVQTVVLATDNGCFSPLIIETPNICDNTAQFILKKKKRNYYVRQLWNSNFIILGLDYGSYMNICWNIDDQDNMISRGPDKWIQLFLPGNHKRERETDSWRAAARQFFIFTPESKSWGISWCKNGHSGQLALFFSRTRRATVNTTWFKVNQRDFSQWIVKRLCIQSKLDIHTVCDNTNESNH